MTDTDVTLRDYFERVLSEMDTRYQQRFDGQTIAINAALLAAEKAVSKAETAAERRFELLNELRVGVATKEEIEALDKLVSALSNRIERSEGVTGGASASWGKLLGIISAVGILVGLVAGLITVVTR